MSTLLAARGVTVAVPGRVLCRELDLAIRPGERWALLGPNGAGKTTLLLTLAGLRPPAAGSVLLDEQPMDAWGRRSVAQRLGLLPQDSADAFPATVLEVALMGRHPHLSRWARESAADVERARAALDAMGLAGMAARAVAGLSGGERRRLALATLLTQDPALLLLDEPLNHLDLGHQAALMVQLAAQARAGKAVFMSLHDPSLAARWCDRVLLLYGDGRWEAGETGQILEPDRLEGLYGHPLVQIQGPHGPVFVST